MTSYKELIEGGMSPEEARKFLLSQHVEVITKPAPGSFLEPDRCPKCGERFKWSNEKGAWECPKCGWLTEAGTPLAHEWAGYGWKKTALPTPIEAYVEGPPQEVLEAKPLKERQIPILKAQELAEIIRQLREDTVAMSQLRIDFPGGVAWAVPTRGWGGGYLLVFKAEKLVVGSRPGAAVAEELKELHEQLKVKYPEPWKVERHYRADKNVHYFWAIKEREAVFRSDPYLLAREVLDLRPTRLSFQQIPGRIYPPPGLKPSEVPWRLKGTRPPEYLTPRE